MAAPSAMGNGPARPGNYTKAVHRIIAVPLRVSDGDRDVALKEHVLLKEVRLSPCRSESAPKLAIALSTFGQ